MASIVNVRRDFGPQGGHRLRAARSRLFASRHPVPAGMALQELASFVHAETSRVKRGRSFYLQTLLAIGLSALALARYVDRGGDRLSRQELRGAGRA